MRNRLGAPARLGAAVGTAAMMVIAPIAPASADELATDQDAPVAAASEQLVTDQDAPVAAGSEQTESQDAPVAAGSEQTETGDQNPTGGVEAVEPGPAVAPADDVQPEVALEATPETAADDALEAEPTTEPASESIPDGPMTVSAAPAQEEPQAETSTVTAYLTRGDRRIDLVASAQIAGNDSGSDFKIDSPRAQGTHPAGVSWTMLDRKTIAITFDRDVEISRLVLKGSNAHVVLDFPYFFEKGDVVTLSTVGLLVNNGGRAPDISHVSFFRGDATGFEPTDEVLIEEPTDEATDEATDEESAIVPAETVATEGEPITVVLAEDDRTSGPVAATGGELMATSAVPIGLAGTLGALGLGAAYLATKQKKAEIEP